jgi:hypothetical protein
MISQARRLRRRRVVRCLIAIALVAVACGGSPAGKPDASSKPSPPISEAATMVLGAPAADGVGMAPLVDGQDVALVEGAQGGFHVWFEFRLRGVTAGTVTLERGAHRVSDGAVVLRSRETLAIADAGADGWWQSDRFAMFMCPTPIGLSIVDVSIAYVVTLSDDAGAELARAAVTLTPHCPDVNHDFCMRICTG